jgi:hypothetical protein
METYAIHVNIIISIVIIVSIIDVIIITVIIKSHYCHRQHSRHHHRHNGFLLFLVEILPDDDTEYYQFIYFSVKTGIRGISRVFNFTSPFSDKFVEEEDDEGLVVVTSRVGVLESKIAKLEEVKETHQKNFNKHTHTYIKKPNS